MWETKVLKHPVNGEHMYGRGIEYSLLLESATKAIPARGQVALFNLSWDGGNTGSVILYTR